MSNCHSSWPPHHPLITPCPLSPVPVSTATHLSAPVTSDHCPPRPASPAPQHSTNYWNKHQRLPRRPAISPPTSIHLLPSSTECNL